MPYNPIFFVPTVDLKKKIEQKGKVQLVDFTILSHLLTDNLDAEIELLNLCISAFPREFIRNLVCLKPLRLIEHEILAQLQATIKLDKSVEDETNTFGQAFTLVQEALSPQQPDINEICLEIYSDTKKNVSLFVGALSSDELIPLSFSSPQQRDQLIELYNSLSKHEPWQSNKELLNNVCIQRALALFYTQRIREYIQPIVKQQIEKLCDLQQLESLTPVTNRDAIAVFTTGGVASGKGSCLRVICDTLKEREPCTVPWNELVHHNADRLKLFLLNPEENPFNYSQYTYEEALFIKERIMSIIEQNGATSKMYPHFLHDQTKLKGEELKEARRRYGEIFIAAVSTEAVVAIERAYSRGKETTRFEHTEGLLSSHQAAPVEFIKALNQEELIGQIPINIVMYDNNHPSKHLIMFASIDMQKKQITVYNNVCMQAWIKKEKIYPQAQSEEELYKIGPTRPTEQYFQPLVDKGFHLEVLPLEMSPEDEEPPSALTCG
jgi:hypothetical protein